MKYLITFLILISPTLVFANPDNQCNDYTESFYNKCEEKHNDKPRMEVGAGVDVILYETKTPLEEVLAEYRYDWQNGEHKAYLVGRLNIFRFFKKDK